MAIPCQGFTFTWGTATLLEVRQLEVNYQRGMPTSRTTRWSGTPGSLSVIGFAATGLPETEYGRKRRLTITAPVNKQGGTITLLDRDCIYTDMAVRATANEAVEFAYSFMLLDTVNNVLIESN